MKNIITTKGRNSFSPHTTQRNQQGAGLIIPLMIATGVDILVINTTIHIIMIGSISSIMRIYIAVKGFLITSPLRTSQEQSVAIQCRGELRDVLVASGP